MPNQENQGMMQQKAQPQQIQMQQQEQENVFQNSWKEIQEHNIDLQESRKRSVFGIARQDSAEMTKVKHYQKVITNMMQAPLSQDEAQFELQIQEMEDIYAKLVDAAQKYMATHKKPRSDEGKARLRLVQNSMFLATKEMSNLRMKGEQMRQKVHQEGEQLSWGNVTSGIRGAEFNLNQYQHGQGGAGTSEVTIIELGQERVFYKEKERLCTPKAEFEKEMQSDMEEEDKLIYEKLYRILKNSRMEDAFFKSTILVETIKTAETEKQWTEVLKILRNNEIYLKDLEGLNLNDVRTREVLKKMLPKVQKWMTRSDACIDAKIGDGENLSDRNILTSRTAALLKTSNVVANSNTATLHKDGQNTQMGIAMQQAKGKDYGELLEEAMDAGKQVVYTPEAMRQFSCLQLLDSICGQIDRHTSNIFVTSEEKNGQIVITGVQGIDNDMAFGELDFEKIKKMGCRNLPSLVDWNGKCTLPAIDKNMFLAMQTMTRESLSFFFGDMLSGKYQDALWARWQGIIRLIKRNPNLLVEKWDENAATNVLEKSGYIPQAARTGIVSAF